MTSLDLPIWVLRPIENYDTGISSSHLKSSRYASTSLSRSQDILLSEKCPRLTSHLGKHISPPPPLSFLFLALFRVNFQNSLFALLLFHRLEPNNRKQSETRNVAPYIKLSATCAIFIILVKFCVAFFFASRSFGANLAAQSIILGRASRWRSSNRHGWGASNNSDSYWNRYIDREPCSHYYADDDIYRGSWISCYIDDHIDLHSPWYRNSYYSFDRHWTSCGPNTSRCHHTRSCHYHYDCHTFPDIIDNDLRWWVVAHNISIMVKLQYNRNSYAIAEGKIGLG